jgi:hypothetical protein
LWKYEAQRELMKALTRKFTLGNDYAKIGIVGFANEGKTYLDLASADSTDLDKLDENIDKSVSSGGTYVEHGFQTATAMFDSSAREGAKRIAILLLDGTANCRNLAGDDVNFISGCYNLPCSSWAGYDCSDGVYTGCTAEHSAALRAACPGACSVHSGLNPTCESLTTASLALQDPDGTNAQLIFIGYSAANSTEAAATVGQPDPRWVFVDLEIDAIAEQLTKELNTLCSQIIVDIPDIIYDATDVQKASFCLDTAFCADGEYDASTNNHLQAEQVENRDCQPCPNNTYTAVVNGELQDCAAQPPCGVGTKYVESAVGLRTCETCSSDAYQSATSHFNTECVSQPLCGVGQFYTASLVSEATCSACGALTFMAVTDHSNQACSEQPKCGVGEYFIDDQSAERTCSNCDSEYYQLDADHTQSACRPQTILCGAGEKYVDSAIAVATCTPCEVLTFQTSAVHRETDCLAQTSCTEGEFFIDSTVAERKCEACPYKTYRTDQAHQEEACVSQPTKCKAGDYFIDASNANATCAPCPSDTSILDEEHTKPLSSCVSQCFRSEACQTHDDCDGVTVFDQATYCASDKRCYPCIDCAVDVDAIDGVCPEGCNEADVLVGQTFPVVGSTERLTVGVAVAPILANASLDDLVLYNQTACTVVFASDAEGVSYPQRMTQRVATRLEALCTSIPLRFGIGVSLKVNRAYEVPTNIAEVDFEVTYFQEGRAVELDLQCEQGTSLCDNDVTRISTLTKLTYAAGFEFVQYTTVGEVEVVYAISTEESCSNAIDLVFLLDESASIDEEGGSGTFRNSILPFVQSMVAPFNVGSGENDTHVGVAVFGSKANGVVGLQMNSVAAHASLAAMQELMTLGYQTVVDYGPDGCTSQAKCDVCEGDCDNDDECAGDLKCYTEGAIDYGQGCDRQTKGLSGYEPSHHYCYSPASGTRNGGFGPGVVQYDKGSTKSSLGLETVANSVFTAEGGMRDYDAQVPRVLIMITDGKSDFGYEPGAAALALQAQGVHVFAVGVGTCYDEDELNSIASNPDDEHVFGVKSFLQMNRIVNRIASATCAKPALRILNCAEEAETAAVLDGRFTFFVIAGAEASVEVVVTVTSGAVDVFVDSVESAPRPGYNSATAQLDATTSTTTTRLTVARIGSEAMFVSLRGNSGDATATIKIEGCKCPTDYRVLEHRCIPCANTGASNAGGDDAFLCDTECTTPACGAGSYAKKVSGDEITLECAACPVGHYCEDGINAVACPIGTYGDAPSATALSECTICPTAGHACNLIASESLVSCGAGTFATLSTDGCTTCPLGHECPDGVNKAVCLKGTYAFSAAANCSACPAGFACPSQQTSTPQRCQSGYYSSEDGTACIVCPAGSRCPANFGSAIPCEAGTYAGAKAMSSCDVCPSGHACTSTTKAACVAGTAASQGSGACNLCPSGYFSPVGASKCLLCPAGQACATPTLDGVGYTDPANCPDGEVSALGHIDCAPCPSGTSAAETSDTCLPCSAGSACAVDAQTTDPVECSSGSTNIQPASTTECWLTLDYGDILRRHGSVYLSDATISARYSDVTTESDALIKIAELEAADPSNMPVVWQLTFAADETSAETSLVVHFEKFFAQTGLGIDAGKTSADFPMFYMIDAAHDYTGTMVHYFGNCFAPALPTGASCTLCPAGYECNAPDVPMARCLHGTYSVGNQTDCTVCPAGYECPSMSISPIACDAGHYSIEGATVCHECGLGLACPESSSEPTICYSGTYTLSATSTTCDVCPAGHQCGDPAQQPVPCLAGTYGTIEGAAVGAETCSDCPSGFECPTPDVAPAACAAGWYSSARSVACTACPAGSHCVLRATEPVICLPGTYSFSSASVCTICPTNHSCPTVAAVDEATAAIECSAGTYSGIGEAMCTACEDGHQCTAGPVTVKEACPNGWLSMANNGCYQCPSGFTCPTSDVDPVPCEPGTYSRQGDLFCQLCPAGSACPEQGEPFPCYDGQYSLLANIGANCTDCPGGYACHTVDDIPELCMAGWYSAGNATACAPCPVGHICPDEGMVTAMVNTYTASDGKMPDPTRTRWLDCPAGFQCYGDDITTLGAPAETSNYCSAAYCNAAVQNGDAPTGCCQDTDTGSYYCCVAGGNPLKEGSDSCCTGGDSHTNLRTSCSEPCCEVGYSGASCNVEATVVAGVQLRYAAPCQAGTWSGLGESLCTPCPEGYRCTLDEVHICPEGWWSDAGELVCTKCADGYICGAGAQNHHDITATCEALTDNAIKLGTDGPLCAGSVTEAECLSWVKISGGEATCQWTDILDANGTPIATVPKTECDLGGWCDGMDRFECPDGTYNNVSTTAVDLEICTLCPAGYFCSQYQHPQFGATAEESLSTVLGQASQWPSPTLCPAGRYCPDGTKDPNEFACPAGTYNPLTGKANVTDCLVCPAGQYCTEGTSVTQDCPNGYFCPESTRSADQWICEPGTYGDGTNKRSQDGCNDACPGGHYCPGILGIDPAFPIKCPEGTYGPEMYAKSKAQCLQCPEGKACPLPGLIEASENCAAGHFCPVGTIMPTDSPCPAGTYTEATDLAAETECTLCPGGSMCGVGTDQIGVFILPCGAGHYCPPGSARSKELWCPAGTFTFKNNLADVSECSVCPAGYYCLGGSASPTAMCRPGHYCPAGTRRSDNTRCPAGTYSPAYGAKTLSDCLPCTRGHFCEEATVQPATCPVGTFNEEGAYQDASVAPASNTTSDYTRLAQCQINCRNPKYEHNNHNLVLELMGCELGCYNAQPQVLGSSESATEEERFGLCEAKCNADASYPITGEVCKKGCRFFKESLEWIVFGTPGEQRSDCVGCTGGFVCDFGTHAPVACPVGEYSASQCSDYLVPDTKPDENLADLCYVAAVMGEGGRRYFFKPVTMFPASHSLVNNENCGNTRTAGEAIPSGKTLFSTSGAASETSPTCKEVGSGELFYAYNYPRYASSNVGVEQKDAVIMYFVVNDEGEMSFVMTFDVPDSVEPDTTGGKIVMSLNAPALEGRDIFFGMRDDAHEPAVRHLLL